MPDVTIIKLKIRRGTNAQRTGIVLEQGELGYTIDTQRVFVGDGITQGGIPTSTIAHLPISSPADLILQTNAVTNDIVYAGTSIFQLTADDYTKLDNWVQIGSNFYTDNSTIDSYLNGQQRTLRVKNNGIAGNKFAASAAYSVGGLVATRSNGLSANVDNSTIRITSTNQLSVGNIDNRHISSSAFTNGIKGGGSSKIEIDIDSSQFGFISNTATLTALPNNVVKFENIDANIFSGGIVQTGNTFSTKVNDCDSTTLQNIAGVISIKPTIPLSGDAYLKTVVHNNTGQITQSYYTIESTLSCRDPDVRIFNGAPRQSNTPLTTQTVIVAVNNSDSSTISLTSAGFITFKSTGSRIGTAVERFAVPIFTY
jgi:hypothetical protein